MTSPTPEDFQALHERVNVLWMAGKWTLATIIVVGGVAVWTLSDILAEMRTKLRQQEQAIAALARLAEETDDVAAEIKAGLGVVMERTDNMERDQSRMYEAILANGAKIDRLVERKEVGP